MIRLLRSERGFTLIEMAIAVGLFGIVMIGMAMSFRGAFRTAGQARVDQVAKAAAQERLELIRSYPYYVALKEKTGDVDILDRFYPDINQAAHATPEGSGQYLPSTDTVATDDDHRFVTTRTVTKPTAPPLTETVTVQFGVANTTGVFVPKPPIASYDSNNADFDSPGANAIRIVVNLTWTQAGRTRSVTNQTIVTRIESETAKLEASGALLAATIDDIRYEDGDISGVEAIVEADIGEAEVNFREVTTSSSQSTADPVEVSELDRTNELPLQSAGPAEGAISATVPNSTTGNTQGPVSGSVGSGSMASTELPTTTIASWCTSAACTASGSARVSTTHSQNPEGRADVTARDVIIYARDPLEAVPHRVFEVGTATGSLEQISTQTSSVVEGATTLTNARVWGSTSFVVNPRYEGTVTIESLSTEVRTSATANCGAASCTASATNHVEWAVIGLRVFDPNKINLDGTIGGYGSAFNFGFDSSCGQWTGIPPGEPGHVCSAPMENPNPVTIPAAYSGLDGDDPATSLLIVAGSTVQEQNVTSSQGIADATTAQKNVLTITTRDDLVGAAALEPALIGLGSLTSSVSLLFHEHP